MSWPPESDRSLVEVLRAQSIERAPHPAAWFDALLERAELHGVAGVVQDLLENAGSSLGQGLRDQLARRRLARELDHAAHLGMLGRIDAALARAELRAVVLKGPLLAERLYARPSARATSDTDLLVNMGDLDRAARALADVGYVLVDDAKEQAWSLREHHHFHLAHPHALPLELHFHAYRGLGTVLRGEPLLGRSMAHGSFGALRVLSPSDELVFLAVHAAVHRFVRLGWLYDLKLLLERVSEVELVTAATSAAELGYAQPLALAASLLFDVMGVPSARVEPLAGRRALRIRALRAIVAEPEHPLARSATRFAYTLALCGSARAALRYASRSTRQHALQVMTSAARAH